ncbi:MAG: TIGR04283 family arsenosugar biosynthesis glycosyltransferase [Pseudomonadota bacterium]
MPAPITVVIPTLNSTASLEMSLPPLMEGVSEGLIHSVIFADGGSEDGIVDLAKETGAILIRSKPGRGNQLSAGCRAAEGKWLLVLHADTILPEGWSRVVQKRLEKKDFAYAFKLSFDAEGFPPRFVAGWANFRTRLFRLPYGDQGLLIPKQLYSRVGGYAEIPLMEDVNLAKKLGRCVRLMPARVTTSAEKYVRDGWFRRGAKNLWLVIRYRLGANPEKLARAYNR